MLKDRLQVGLPFSAQLQLAFKGRVSGASFTMSALLSASKEIFKTPGVSSVVIELDDDGLLSRCSSPLLKKVHSCFFETDNISFRLFSVRACSAHGRLVSAGLT